MLGDDIITRRDFRVIFVGWLGHFFGREKSALLYYVK